MSKDTKTSGQQIMADIKQHKKEAKEKKMNNFKDAVARFIEYIIIPFGAKVAIAAFALKGVMQFLPNLSHDQQLGGAVLVIALLSYVAYKSK